MTYGRILVGGRVFCRHRYEIDLPRGGDRCWSRFDLVCVGNVPLNGPQLGQTASRRDLGALGRNE